MVVFIVDKDRAVKYLACLILTKRSNEAMAHNSQWDTKGSQVQRKQIFFD